MRIVIDMQGAQTESRFRGIGRYTMNFAQAVVRNRGGHEVILALNGLLSESIEPIRAAFDGLLPQEQIVVWEASGPVAGIDRANTRRRYVTERIREAFLAFLQPDWVVVASLFEGLMEDAAVSLTRHTALPTAVVLYDLIPWIYPEIYLENTHPALKSWYLEKLDHLRRADLLLPISESSGREAIEYLGFDPAAVVVIGADCGPRFRPIGLSEDQRVHLRTTYGIERPFVLYTGGIDHRKNIEGLIRAHASLRREIRRAHQLVVVCAIQPPERAQLLSLARKSGLKEGELVLTGFVPDDDLLALYNACTLFVFPSWHEGFGLPALEAMRCGKAVLAANTSSLPEVVGRKDALFNPSDESAMAALIQRALSDHAFRRDLERHGLKQSQRFSWDKTAQKALEALETAARPAPTLPAPGLGRHRPRLAYISPLPPEKTGIADYSAELIPELTRWYELEVIVTQPEMVDTTIRAICPIRSIGEFRTRAATYDRVLYHFGNSIFHKHMFGLLDEIPGVVVLHDFFLSGIQAHRELCGLAPHALTRALMEGHGYRAVSERWMALDTAEVVWRYPANLQVLQRAVGVIVHSEYSRTLARQWYGDSAASDWAVIPHLRTPVFATNREAARGALELGEHDLLVCSFGIVGSNKLNHRLLKAWLDSPLASDPKAHLVFVGENDPGTYGHDLLRRIRKSRASKRIRITGWADTETYRRYLAAADIGVQLRAMSRGETSGTVLDCMNYGLATIVNAHGSMADLDSQAVWKLPDEFSDDALIEALTILARDAERRHALGERARQIIRTRHAPRGCAEQYFQAIERFYQQAEIALPGILRSLAHHPPPKEDLPRLALSLARNFPPAPRRRQLLVDVSELVQHDAKSGIQRVVRAILKEWLDHPPEGFQVEPVYATADASGYRYARRWTSRFLGLRDNWTEDTPAEAWPDDVFVGLDLQPRVVPAQRAFLFGWRNRGVKVWFVVYDLSPVLMPEFFVKGGQGMLKRWLETISQFDGVVAISRAVADQMTQWLDTFGPKRERPLSIGWFHLGADMDRSAPTKGLPSNAQKVLSALSSHPSFLMVGTIEPRKAHAQVLEAFEQLWHEGADLNLVIVGKEGWMVEKLINQLRTHPERDRRLFWLQGISDEYLEKIYQASTCLIAASHGEGFGLPLVEAAQHKLPIIARDIPVFREVAGEHAYYFADEKDPEAIAHAVRTWLHLHRTGKAPLSAGMPWLTWKESAQRLAKIILNNQAESWQRATTP